MTGRRDAPDLSSVDPNRPGWQSGKTASGAPCRIKLHQAARSKMSSARQRSAAEARRLVPLRIGTRYTDPREFEVYEVGPSRASRRNGAKRSVEAPPSARRDPAAVLRRVEVWRAAHDRPSRSRAAPVGQPTAVDVLSRPFKR